jgi:hypothetical protein
VAKNQCWGSMTFGADPDPGIRTPAPDPTPFFSDFEDAKEIISHILL